MNKKWFGIFFLLTFFIFIPNINAAYGDVRYEVTSMELNGNNISFKGWAFIHRTQNYVDYSYANSSFRNTGGGQRIKIIAYANGRQIDEKEVTGGSDYNFYCQMYNFKLKKSECENAYYGRFDPVYGSGSLDGMGNLLGQGSNRCKEGSDSRDQCLYEDIGFDINFDISSWHVSEGTEITFGIMVYNNDYGRWSKKLDLGVVDKNASIDGNSSLQVKPGTLSNYVRVFATSALIRAMDGGYLLFDRNNRLVGSSFDGICNCGDSPRYDCADCHWRVANGVYRVKNVVKSETNEFGLDPGKYVVDLGNNIDGVLWGSWVVSNTTLVLMFGGSAPDNCDVSISSSCNNSTNVISNCQSKESVTVTDYSGAPSIGSKKVSANIKYNVKQDISMSNILTPTTTYAGAGFKFGVMYYNSFTWSKEEPTYSCSEYERVLVSSTTDIDYSASWVCTGYRTEEGREECAKTNPRPTVTVNKYENQWVSSSCSSGYDSLKSSALSSMENSFKAKIKKSDDFENGISFVSNVNGSNLDIYNKECNYEEDKENKKIKMSCIFYLPNYSISNYTGKVSYNNISYPNRGLNNKYYTPIAWSEGKNPYTVMAKIDGLNGLKESSIGTWSEWDTDLSCAINLYPLLGIPKGISYKYLFIYRPIDLNNPFPNRNAGMNWYDWYNNSQNKDRLEKSYNKLQYQITLDSKLVSEIKKYNKNELNNGGYLDWKTIDELGNSSFVDEYFNTKRQNIVK